MPSAGDVKVHLPAPASVPNGKLYFIKKVDRGNNNVVIDASQIDGVARDVLSTSMAVAGVATDGSAWWEASPH